ncbi:hypothetical protein GCM10007906_04360 [Vibrio hyugaensis]|uniref:Uncharacterized protein n=1 Tax=Vibrio hyugaensis TaxID=1534743 RepID=A0ABQ5XWL0_9VIBR|nr:hypothetical protein GCM10007906_04360 [Vibrio hyugaensis]
MNKATNVRLRRRSRTVTKEVTKRENSDNRKEKGRPKFTDRKRRPKPPFL